MKVLNDLIEKIENVYKTKKNYFSAVFLISRLYIRFLETGSFGYADNAFFISVKRFKYNTQNIMYVLIAAFFEMETGRLSSAIKRISVCENYRNYLKNNKPEIYAFYLYILALIFLKRKETRESFKIYREIHTVWEQSNNVSILLFLAELNIEYDNFGNAKKKLEYYFSKSERNYFFYICLYKYFNSKNKSVYYTEPLFVSFLKWGISHGLNLQPFIRIYSNKIREAFKNNKLVCFKLYSLYEDEEILKEICSYYIENNDFSAKASEYYSLAVKKQIFIPKLNNFFVLSSFYNDKLDFGIYPIKMFLKYGELSDKIKPYIYHLILTNKKFMEVLDEYIYDISDFGIVSAQNGFSGRYYNSVYKFIIENKNKFDVEKDLLKKMKDILFPQLFLYEIEIKNPDIKYCFVIEKNKEKLSVYNVEGKTCVINKISESAKIFFSNSKKQFIDEDIIIKRCVDGASFGLYKTFYFDGYISDELELALADYYINMEYTETYCLKIFERVLKQDISFEFRMKILAAVGNLYYFNMNLDKAFECFKNIELKYVKDKYISIMFDVFIENMYFDRAAEIIAEKSHCIPDKILYHGIRKLIKIPSLSPFLVRCVYELVLKSRYDRNMIELLTKFYKGGRKDWLLVCDILYDMGTPNHFVDEKLMALSIQTRVFDSKVQSVFSAMYENDRSNNLIEEFAEYCCYEMIVNSVMPERGTIDILESLFFLNKNEMISYALSHTYLIHGLKTENSNEIISAALEFMKKRNLLFPIFKNIENDFSDDLYIEKNCPFIYYAPSDKSVLFYFREKGEFDFYSKSMLYLDFGIYYINIPVFYGEEIEYYICENKEKGSIETPKKIILNKNMKLHKEIEEDDFFELNNSIIYEDIGRYEDSENIINKKIIKNNKLRCTLI